MVRRFSRPRPSHQNDTDSDIAENIHYATEIRNAAKAARFRRLFFEKSRPIQIDDVLWFICFGLTMLMLDVPNTVLFHHKVDWHVLALYACAAVIFLTHFVGLVFRVMNNKQQRINPKYGALAGIVGIILSSFFFSLAVWPIYNVWSIFICFVTTMTYIALISII